MAFPKPTSSLSGYAKRTGQTLEFYALHLDQSIEFDAFLNTFNQNFSSTWNEEAVYGRNDPLATFQGTTRKISVGWSIPAGTLANAKSNLQRCSALIQMMYPSYTTNVTKNPPDQSAPDDTSSGADLGVTTVNASSVIVLDQQVLQNNDNALVMSKSPLIRLKYANLISNSSLSGGSAKVGGLLGWMSSLSWNPVLDMGVFEAGQGQVYPKVIELSVEFNVLHEHELGNKSNTKQMINKNASAKFPFNF